MRIISMCESIRDCSKFALSMTFDLIRIIKDEKKKERLCLSMA